MDLTYSGCQRKFLSMYLLEVRFGGCQRVDLARSWPGKGWTESYGQWEQRVKIFWSKKEHRVLEELKEDKKTEKSRHRTKIFILSLRSAKLLQVSTGCRKLRWRICPHSVARKTGTSGEMSSKVGTCHSSFSLEDNPTWLRIPGPSLLSHQHRPVFPVNIKALLLYLRWELPNFLLMMPIF